MISAKHRFFGYLNVMVTLNLDHNMQVKNKFLLATIMRRMAANAGTTICWSLAVERGLFCPCMSMASIPTTEIIQGADALPQEKSIDFQLFT